MFQDAVPSFVITWKAETIIFKLVLKILIIFTCDVKFSYLF